MKTHELLEEHIKRVQQRYRDAAKWEKTQILNELERTWRRSRKYLIARLGGKRVPDGSPRGRKSHYDTKLVEHITILWDSMERICERRMKAALPVWLPFYQHPDFSPKLREQLLSMSPSTIGRFLQLGMKRIKGLSATRKSKFFKYKIPLHVFGEKIVKAGHMAADTVAHCGDRLEGSYANSLTLTDRLSAWTVNRAMSGKTAFVMKAAMQALEKELPFPLLSIQNDCGTEFLNYSFLRYLENRIHPVVMTRSRPYHKNDNAHVEQKNNTHVRGVFGYERVEDMELISLMNEIYEHYWNPLNNFFLPSMKLLEKERNGSRITKRYDKGKTPYQRLMLAPNMTDHQKKELEKRFEILNPFELKRGLEKKLDVFFSLLKSKRVVQKAA